jgi:hypothetical protein
MSVVTSQASVLSRYYNIDITKNAAGKRIMFPERLFRMMEDIETRHKNLSHIVSWHHKNDFAFAIHKPDDFVREVMPIYFGGQTKMASFQRQLKNYGFNSYRERIKKVGMVYCHKHFSRENPLSLQNVVLKSPYPTKKPSTTTKNTTMNTTLTSSALLQMMPKRPWFPQETSQRTVSLDTTTKPLPSDNLGDEILDEAVTELLWRYEEAFGEDFCFDDDMDCQHHHDSSSRLAVQQWDPEVEALESIEEEPLHEGVPENLNIYQVTKKASCLGCKMSIDLKRQGCLCEHCTPHEAEIYLVKLEVLREAELRYAELWAAAPCNHGTVCSDIVCTGDGCTCQIHHRKKVLAEIRVAQDVVNKFLGQ